MSDKEIKLVFSKMEDGKNLPVLSSVYENNCSNQKTVVVDDDVLEIFKQSRRDQEHERSRRRRHGIKHIFLGSDENFDAKLGLTVDVPDALEEMQAAAAVEGLTLYVVSGCRSYETQEAVYAGWVNQDVKELADTYLSRAGYSDHQTGYTFDLNSLEQDFAYTEEGIWLAEHCVGFGLIIRYPEGKEMYMEYTYEPWHVRFFGKEKAKKITDSGLRRKNITVLHQTMPIKKKSDGNNLFI